jgi:hypothetical protein
MAADRHVHEARTPWLTGWQGGFLALLIGVLLVILGTAAVQRPDYLNVLWNHSLGFKMAATAAVLLSLGTAGFVLGCFWINRASARLEGKRKPIFHVLLVVLAVGYVVLFYLPAVFTALIGPAAVQIQENLR